MDDELLRIALLQAIQVRVGKAHATYEAIRVLREVFNLPLFDLMSLGSWVGFESGNPGFSDDEIERLYDQKFRGSIRSPST